MKKALLVLAVVVGLGFATSGVVQLAAADGAPCVAVITKDAEGTIWWTMCSSMDCPPEKGWCLAVNHVLAGWTYITCECDGAPEPVGCVPAMSQTGWVPVCWENCPSPLDCPDGGWSPVGDGFVWVCPGCA